MSEFTELSFDAKLRKDIPEGVLTTLQYMVEAQEKARSPSPPDPDEGLFATKSWHVMLRSDEANLSYRRSTLRYDDVAAAYILCVQCSLRNDEDQIEKFVDWVSSHVDEPDGKLLGFHRLHPSKWPTPIHMWRSPADRKAIEEAQKKLPQLSNMPHDIDKIDQAALALLLIGRHEYYRTWKGIDWSVMGRLYQRGFISNPVGTAKSVGFTTAGMLEAERLFRTLFAP
jgi:hypothetical protein